MATFLGDKPRAAGNPEGDSRIPRTRKLIPTPPEPEQEITPRHIGDPADSEPSNAVLLKLVQDAETISREFHTSTLARPIARAYRAWRNEHSENSKYLGPGMKGRSRLFVPKTRTAVRKNMATAMAAMFSTDDVANVSAVYEDDKTQLASAAVKKELLNYRMTRGFTPTSIDWFRIAMGGVHDSQHTGAVISKQYWEYQTVDDGEEIFEQDVFDDLTGEFIDTIEVERRPIKRVVLDRPMIDLCPVENCSLDPAAPWYDPIGRGAWFFARYPMYVGQAKAMIESAVKAGVDHGWLPLDQIDFTKGRIEDERSATRRAREGGRDRYEQTRVGDWDLIWVVERFLVHEGSDLHFWTIGDQAIMSKVRDVEEVYPALGGERPYKMGVSGIDPHRIMPMSPVESWQPLQLELNDTTNLRQDALKRSISPLALVKRGAKVDIAAMQRRGQPEAVLTVGNVETDVKFEATPGPSGAAYTETSVTSNNFDELAGVMSTSSVANNRQLNETVGGMQLLSGAANAVSEFDLRVIVETWAEPVLRQISKLIDYYEADEKALHIAGGKAKAWQRFGVDPTLDDLVQTEVTLRINIGIGSADPMQRLAKMKAAIDMLEPIFPIMEKQGVTPNAETIVEEVFGNAGFKDGRRFFNFDEPAQEQGPPPELTELMEKMKIEAGKLDLAREKYRSDNATKLEIERMRGKSDMAQDLIKIEADRVARLDNTMEARVSKVSDHLIAQRSGDKAPTGGRAPSQGAQQPPKSNGSDAVLAAIQQRLGPTASPPPPPPPQPQPQQSGQSDQQMQFMMALMAQMTKAIAQLSAPKQVLRDQFGKIIGMTSAPAGPPQPQLPQDPQALMAQMAKAIEQLSAPKQVLRDQFDKIVGTTSAPAGPPRPQLPQEPQGPPPGLPPGLPPGSF